MVWASRTPKTWCAYWNSLNVSKQNSIKLILITHSGYSSQYSKSVLHSTSCPWQLIVENLLASISPVLPMNSTIIGYAVPCYQLQPIFWTSPCIWFHELNIKANTSSATSTYGMAVLSVECGMVMVVEVIALPLHSQELYGMMSSWTHLHLRSGHCFQHECKGIWNKNQY